MTPPHILVIGSGLAGTTAALLAAAQGARVTVLLGRPGAAAHFSGRLDLYGAAEPPVDRPWTGYAPPPVGAPPPDATTDPGARLAALLERRPWHPLAHLPGLDADTLRTRAAALLAHVAPPDLLCVLPCPAVLPTDAGTAVLADAVATSAAPLPDPHVPLAWIGLQIADAYPAASAARLFAHLTHQPEDACAAAELLWPPAHTAPHPALPIGLLDRGPDTPQGRAFLDAIRKLLPKLPGDAALLLPPLLGRSFESAARWIQVLEDATGRPVRERLGIEQPVFGLRLWTHLQQTLQRHPQIDCLPGPAADLRPELDARGNLRTLHLHLPLRADERALTDLHAVILATGSFGAGGLRADPPLREALLELPLYLDGRLLDAEDTAPSELLGARPGADHPLFNLGLALDDQARPLASHGGPAFSNLYAAGRLLAGTHAALDGTAHSVDLLSAERAVLGALSRQL